MIVEKLQKQDQVIATLNGMLGAQDVHHVKLVSHILKCKMAELKVQLESGHQDYIFIRLMGHDIGSVMESDQLMGHDIKSVMDQLRVNVEAQFSYQYEELEVDVTGTIVVMIGRIWDVKAITSRYLSMDFVVSDSKFLAHHGASLQNYRLLTRGTKTERTRSIDLPTLREYQAVLQKNLMYLAAIADAQPPAATPTPTTTPPQTSTPQIPPNTIPQQAKNYMQQHQAVAALQ
ncbi:hypothetical protein Tco_0632753 [Tanacetum coccineum]